MKTENNRKVSKKKSNQKTLKSIKKTNKNNRKPVAKINKYLSPDVDKSDSDQNYNLRPKLKKRKKRKNRTKENKQISQKNIKTKSKSKNLNQKEKVTHRLKIKSQKDSSITSFDKYWYPKQNPKRSRQKKKKIKQVNEEIWIIRHLHRMNLDEPNKWKEHPRYNQNFLDSPLTEFGKKAAARSAKEIIQNSPNIKKIKYIYTSPFTRCIETSLEIAKEIGKYTGNMVQLCIEYGLAEAVPIHLEFLKVQNKTLFIDKVPILDFKLSSNQIAKDYYPYIDTKYKSLYKKSDIFMETVKESAERIVKVMNYLTNTYKNMIICTHQIPVTIANMYLYDRPYPLAYLYLINPVNKNKKDLDPKRLTSYGILSGFQKDGDRWKYIYPPNNNYYQELPINS
jgi:broad specificity phosphatase PhoE